MGEPLLLLLLLLRHLVLAGGGRVCWRDVLGVGQVELRAVAVRVAEVRVGVVLVGEGLLAGTPGGKELALLGVAPLHAPVLEPDLHLERWGGYVTAL